MCGIVGMSSNDYVDIALFKKLLVESMVRGKHATGISWVENETVKTMTEPVSADKIQIPNIKTMSIIGHCRYSTSNIEYNQPITDSGVSVAHNGVITQTAPENWSKIYKCDFNTECDSEILLKMWLKGIHPLELDGSMAVLLLDKKDECFM